MLALGAWSIIHYGPVFAALLAHSTSCPVYQARSAGGTEILRRPPILPTTDAIRWSYDAHCVNNSVVAIRVGVRIWICALVGRRIWLTAQCMRQLVGRIGKAIIYGRPIFNLHIRVVIWQVRCHLIGWRARGPRHWLRHLRTGIRGPRRWELW